MSAQETRAQAEKRFDDVIAELKRENAARPPWDPAATWPWGPQSFAPWGIDVLIARWFWLRALGLETAQDLEAPRDG